MKKDKLNFSIIGCGRIGARHAGIIAEKGNLLAVCDIVPEKAEMLAKNYHAASYTSIEELFAKQTETDVIVVCTPNGLHAEHSIAALKAGFHVLCEKPMAIHAADCRQMIQVAEKNGKKLLIVKQNRFNPPVVAVKKVLDEGILGKIFSVHLNLFWNRDTAYYANSWKGSMDLDGGTLFTQFSHFIDLMYWMIGDVRETNGIFNNFHHRGIIDFEDTGAVTLRFASGAIGTINYTVNSYAKNMEGSITIFGEKGTVKIGGEYVNELEYQNIEGYEIKDLPLGNPANNYGHYTGSMSNHDKVYDNLIDVLQNGGTIAATGYQGMKTVEIIERIYEDRPPTDR